jgi:rhamnogalacturonan endolyase
MGPKNRRARSEDEVSGRGSGPWRDGAASLSLCRAVAVALGLAQVGGCGAPRGALPAGGDDVVSSSPSDGGGSAIDATETPVPTGTIDSSPGGDAAGAGADAASARADAANADGGGPATIPIAPACPTPTGAPVTLTPSGGGFVVANGLVSIAVSDSGQLTQVTKSGNNLMASGDSLYVSESGGGTYYSIAASSHAVVQQTQDIVELSFVDTAGGNHDMDWDLHYVVRRGVSGFYYFLVTQVGTATHPNPATLSELRTVQRFDSAILANGYTGERHGALPTPAQNATFSPSTQIQDATYPLTVAPTTLPGTSSLPGVVGQHYDEGPVFSKYDWASYRLEDIVHGLYGNGFGAWLVSPSWEFYTGGPVKQELMVHHDNLILNMYHGGHFGSAIAQASPAGWKKIYGPNLVYVNTGDDAAVIADALAQASAERGQWPYCWMHNVDFPLSAQRGTVTGTLTEAHGRWVEGATVVLAQPGALLTQGYDYMFWAQADASGAFTIPAVRAGTYSIHVYATRGTIVDDPANGEIIGTTTVVAGSNALGTVTWAPPYHPHLLWAIGDSDQRSGEFRFSPATGAGPDNTAGRTGRMYGLDTSQGVWTVPPATTTYTIGTSSPQTDWYFAQSANGGWTVKFDLASVPQGGAYLTIGVAGAARNPHLDVAFNGHAVLGQSFGNDQSLYRSALQGGLFQMIAAAVPASALVAGQNVATFTLGTNAAAGAGVYYDIVKLESD